MHNHSNGNELRILIQIKLISLKTVEHQDSLRNQDKQQLGNGPLDCSKTEQLNSFSKLICVVCKTLIVYARQTFFRHKALVCVV